MESARTRMNDIALVTMCRDSEKILPRLLASVEGVVSRLVFMDTGSVDSTVALLKAAGADVLEGEFEDFGKSRTRLMEFAKGKADWFLLLDADHELWVEGEFPVLDLAVPAFAIQHAGVNRYFIPRVLRGNRDWRFIGASHEYLDGALNAPILPGVQVVHHADSSHRSDKFERDIRLLTEELERDPTNYRAMFYLGSSHRDLGELDAALEWYQLRAAAKNTWEEEAFVAQLEAAKITREPLDCWECWLARPTRAEPLHLLEQVYAECGEPEKAAQVFQVRGKIAVPDDILFVDLATYAAPKSG